MFEMTIKLESMAYGLFIPLMLVNLLKTNNFVYITLTILHHNHVFSPVRNSLFLKHVYENNELLILLKLVKQQYQIS